MQKELKKNMTMYKKEINNKLLTVYYGYENDSKHLIINKNYRLYLKVRKNTPRFVEIFDTKKELLKKIDDLGFLI